MRIERKRYVVMRRNRTEVWCGLSKHFSFRPITEVKDISVKTYRSEAQARSGCSSWDRNFEVVPVIEIITTEDALKELQAELEQVKAERDAAVKDLNEFLSMDELCPIQCEWCKWNDTFCDGKTPEWRGVQNE